MTHPVIAFTLLTLLGLTAPLSGEEAVGGPSKPSSVVEFCSALEAIQPGEEIPVLLSGLYSVGHELQILYDPQKPLCGGQVQPSTWVEFSPRAGGNAELDRIVEQSGRALLVVRGRLFGPRQPAPDDTSLPVTLAFANRVASRRYGHLGAFRTKLVVEELLHVEAASASLPWSATWHQAVNVSKGIRLEHAELPQYPPRAQRVGLVGDVVVELTIEGGRIVTVTAVSGDRLLAEAAVENVRTWRFNPQAQARLTTVFSFELERRSPGQSEGTRVVADLPRKVTVFAAQDDW